MSILRGSRVRIITEGDAVFTVVSKRGSIYTLFPSVAASRLPDASVREVSAEDIELVDDRSNDLYIGTLVYYNDPLGLLKPHEIFVVVGVAQASKVFIDGKDESYSYPLLVDARDLTPTKVAF